jgi:hypothetical protein
MHGTPGDPNYPHDGGGGGGGGGGRLPALTKAGQAAFEKMPEGPAKERFAAFARAALREPASESGPRVRAAR